MNTGWVTYAAWQPEQVHAIKGTTYDSEAEPQLICNWEFDGVYAQSATVLANNMALPTSWAGALVSSVPAGSANRAQEPQPIDARRRSQIATLQRQVADAVRQLEHLTSQCDLQAIKYAEHQADAIRANDGRTTTDPQQLNMMIMAVQQCIQIRTALLAATTGPRTESTGDATSASTQQTRQASTSTAGESPLSSGAA